MSMNIKMIYLIIMITGVAFWNLPDSASIMSGGHDYYNNSAPCEKCHYDIQNMLDQYEPAYIFHNSMTCNGCHAPDGNSSHAARISVCTECHNEDHQNPFPICIECHDSHGAQYPGIMHGNGYSCDICHPSPTHSVNLTNQTCIDCHFDIL